MEKELEARGIRIAVLGPECSGKSTLCGDMAEHFAAKVVDEFAVEYLQQRKGRAYDTSDLVRIAHVQAKRNRLAEAALVVCDTEMSTMAIWAEDKLGQIPERILDLECEQVFDHYLLCSPDMPWEPGPFREDVENRGRLFRSYEERLRQLNRQFTVLEGDRSLRLQRVEAFLSK